jgi:hypothetical protein
MFLGYGFGYGRKDVLARQIPMRNFPQGSEEMTFGSNKERLPQQKVRWLKWQFHYSLQKVPNENHQIC